jgi:DNA-binding beta-propeller fold protein YncE
VIDTATDEIVGRIPTTREFPHTAAFSPDGKHALLTQESKGVVPGTMDVVERENLKKVASVDIGLQATGIGVVPPSAPSGARPAQGSPHRLATD